KRSARNSVRQGTTARRAAAPAPARFAAVHEAANGMARPCSHPRWRKPSGSSNAKEHVPCHPLPYAPRYPRLVSTSARTRSTWSASIGAAQSSYEAVHTWHFADILMSERCPLSRPKRSLVAEAGKLAHHVRRAFARAPLRKAGGGGDGNRERLQADVQRV